MDRINANVRRFCPPEPPLTAHWLMCLIPPGANLVEFDGFALPCLHQDEVDLSTVRAATAHAVAGPPGQPRRNLRLRLEASYSARIEGHDSVTIREYLGYRDELEVVSFARTDREKERSRSADRAVRTGDADWKRLAAWPWAAFDEPIPGDWRRDSRAWHSLAEWHRREVGLSAERLARERRRLHRAARVGAA